MKLFYLLIAFAAGVASSLQGLYNGHWQQKIDLKSVLLVNASVVMVGALIYYGVMLVREGEKGGWEQMTPAIAVGGVCGLIIIAAMALAFPKIGPLPAVTLFIAGQLAAAVLLHHFGAFGMGGAVDMTKIAGALLVASGAYLVLR